MYTGLIRYSDSDCTVIEFIVISVDFEAIHGEGVEQSRSRNNSSVHIKIIYNPQARDLEAMEVATVNAQEL